MAGLAAAARAGELGLRPLVLEKGDRAGGSMLLSSGVVWRYRDFARFREECPQGNPALQQLVHERLDDALSWLASLGAPVVERDTGNPLTTGIRFDPSGLAQALVRRVPDLRLREALRSVPAEKALVLATGGFQGDRELVRHHVTPQADALVLRANPWSAGDGLTLALARGAALTAGLDEFYGRNLPAPPARVAPKDFVRLSQLYARFAAVVNSSGRRYEPRTWSELDVVQWTARQPDARAWYLVSDAALGRRVRERTVGEMIEAARAAGGPVVRRRNGRIAVGVVAGITSTLGGLSVDAGARVLGADGRPLADLYAAGADVGGISTGGYSSGLAAALVLGLAAAETLAG